VHSNNKNNATAEQQQQQRNNNNATAEQQQHPPFIEWIVACTEWFTLYIEYTPATEQQQSNNNIDNSIY
jgi:hypothetical protein